MRAKTQKTLSVVVVVVPGVGVGGIFGVDIALALFSFAPCFVHSH